MQASKLSSKQLGTVAVGCAGRPIAGVGVLIGCAERKFRAESEHAANLLDKLKTQV
jgi:L-asparaginase II